MVSCTSSTGMWRNRETPFLARLGVALQQSRRQADQVVKSTAWKAANRSLVAPHDARGDALVVVGRGAFRGVGVQPLVLPRAGGPLPAPRQSVVGIAAAVM
ncbi:MAG: hypothetical protein IPI51_13650 [Betaproteobacteria bacterium]|nr:hypothetical protein [Betaproteobacteria bacterium]